MRTYDLHCSFCGKSSHDVRKLITNNDGTAAICEECVLKCLEMLACDSGISDSEFKLRMEDKAVELAVQMNLPLILLK